MRLLCILQEVFISMKQKQYLVIAVSIFILCILVFIYALGDAGVFAGNKFWVRALACDKCPTHEIIIGRSRLSSQLPDSADKGESSKAFLAGQPNPFLSDYTKTYDYFIITGKLTDVKRVVDDGPQYPVITVDSWQEVNVQKGWVYGFIMLLLLIISILFYRRFVDANKLNILKTSIMVNEDSAD